MLTLRCFGGVAALDTRGFHISLRSRKHTALLLYLVAHPRTVHVREDLARLLWGTQNRRSRHSLSQAVYDIRSKMGPVVAVDANSVRLLPDRIDYELDGFERALKTKSHDAVLDIYRGEFAPDLAGMGAERFDRWLDAERERCRVLVALALRNAQRAAEENGDWDQTCLAALRLVRQNEFDEEAHRALIRGLCMKGDHASVLAHYRTIGSDRQLGTALPLSQLVQWAEGESEAAGFAVREPNATHLYGRSVEFRKLTAAFYDSCPVPLRVAVAGERGMGRSAVLREFARFVASEGGIVQWLAGSLASPSELAAELQRHAGRLRLIVIRADPEHWATVNDALGTSDLSGAMIACLSGKRFARKARAARQVDVVLPFDPLDDESCAVAVNRVDELCSPRQAVESTRLSGGNPALARAIAQTWLRYRYEPDGGGAPNGGCRLAYDKSEEVRQLVHSQFESLAPEERGVVAILSLLAPAARAHAELIFAAGALYPDAAQNGDTNCLDRLKAKGWVTSRRGAVKLTRPLAGYVLGRKMERRERATAHVRAAAALENGRLAARAAAACELAAAGQRERVMKLGCEVAGEALRAGRSPVACRAATLAFDSVSTDSSGDSERLRAGFLLADAELQRGRFRRATGVLNEIAAVARTGDEQGRVCLGLSRAALASGDRIVIGLHRQRLAEAHEHATAEALARAIQVQLAVLETAIGGSRGRRRLAMREIARALHSISKADAAYAGAWCSAFRVLFSEKGQHGSRAEAKLLLEQQRYRLVQLGFDGRSLLAAAECWIAARSGRLREVLEALDKPTDRTRKDRTGSVNLNNLGAVLLELGEFDRANQQLRRCRDLDEELECSAEDRASALLNLAQCTFFQGDTGRCRRYTEQLLSLPDETERYTFGPQALALNGLLALADRNERDVRACAEHLRECADAPGEDLYLVDWFLAVTAGRGNPAECLLDAAERTAASDRLSAEKLRVLAGLLAPGEERAEQRGARGFLRSAGSSWFLRFATRWAQSTTW